MSDRHPLSLVHGGDRTELAVKSVQGPLVRRLLSAVRRPVKSAAEL